jgi:hypothetical protein
MNTIILRIFTSKININSLHTKPIKLFNSQISEEDLEKKKQLHIKL